MSDMISWRKSEFLFRMEKSCEFWLKRNTFSKVCHGDKAAQAADMPDVFRTGQRGYTVEESWGRWYVMCYMWC